MSSIGMKRRRMPQAQFADAPLLTEAAARPKSLKNRMRSLQRLMAQGEKKGLPSLPLAAVKNVAKKLKVLGRAAADASFIKLERTNGAAYHGVRFLDRTKCGRRLKQVATLLANIRAGTAPTLAKNDDESVVTSVAAFPRSMRGYAAVAFDASSPIAERERAAATLHRELQLSMVYIQWFPRHLKYISLFPSYDRGASASSDAPDGTAEDAAPDAKRRKGETPDAVRAKAEQRYLWARAWALANAEAGQFLRRHPSEAAAVDTGAAAAGEGGSDSDDGEAALDVEALMSRRANTRAPGQPMPAPAEEGGPKRPQPKQRQLPGQVAARVRGVDDAPVASHAPPPRSAAAAAASLSAAAEDMTEEADAAGMAAFASDPFFAGASANDDATLPVFREQSQLEEEALVAETGAVHGVQTAAARFERERLGTGRYRDSARSRVVPVPDADAEGALAKLSDRNRRRAAVWSAAHGGSAAGFRGSGSRAALDAARFPTETLPRGGREAFFGTSLDTGARMRSEGASWTRRGTVPPPPRGGDGSGRGGDVGGHRVGGRGGGGEVHRSSGGGLGYPNARPPPRAGVTSAGPVTRPTLAPAAASRPPARRAQHLVFD